MTMPSLRYVGGSSDTARTVNMLVDAYNESSVAVLGSEYAIVAVADTWADTGLSIALPRAGKYLLFANTISKVAVSAGVPAYIMFKLYNSTDAADVASSEFMGGIVDVTGATRWQTSTLVLPYVADGADTVKLYARRRGGSSWSVSSVTSDVNGRTSLGYVLLSMES